MTTRARPCWQLQLPCCLARDREDDGYPSSPSSPPNQAKTVNRQRMMLQHSSSDILDDYEFGDKIGQGGFGSVHKAWMKGATGDSRFRAVKTVPKAKLGVEMLVRREIAILRRLDHPGICRLLETYDTKDCMYMVMEYIEGRELFDEILYRHGKGSDGTARFNERSAAHITKQVCSALAYCHQRQVLHRDLKPENIMVLRSAQGDEPVCLLPSIKVIDFGLAVMTKQSTNSMFTSDKQQGTPEYLAPECRQGKFLPASDMYSLGVILFAVLKGRLPAFHGGEVQLKKGVSELAKDHIMGLLRQKPSERLTAQQAQKHPWITGAGRSNDVAAGTVSSEAEAGPDLVDMGSAAVGFLSFHKSNKLRKAGLTAVALQQNTNQLSELREQFAAIDTDGNGVISRDELLEAVRRKPPAGMEDPEAWCQQVFDSADTDNSGEIEFTEWVAAAQKNSASECEEAMLAAFRVFDLDGNGSISKEELADFFKGSTEDVESTTCLYDLNNDGEIDFEEFKEMLLHCGQSPKAGSGSFAGAAAKPDV